MLPIHVFFTTTVCSNISHVILYVFHITFVSPILCNTGLVFRVISLFLHPFGKFNLGANSMSFCMFSQFSYFGGVCVISAEVTSHAHDWLFISRRFVLQARSILQILQRMSRLQSCPQDCTQIWPLPSLKLLMKRPCLHQKSRRVLSEPVGDFTTLRSAPPVDFF